MMFTDARMVQWNDRMFFDQRCSSFYDSVADFCHFWRINTLSQELAVGTSYYLSLLSLIRFPGLCGNNKMDVETSFRGFYFTALKAPHLCSLIRGEELSMQ